MKKSHPVSKPRPHPAAPKRRLPASPAESDPSFDDEDVAATLTLAIVEPRGAELDPETRSVVFGYHDPAARAVHLVGTFNDWNVESLPLAPGEDGFWLTELVLPTGRYEYRFYVDGQWCDDPKAASLVPNPFGSFNAVVEV